MKLKKNKKADKTKAAALPKKTHIYFVLDRSGSMASIADDVIGGFNKYVEDQEAAGDDDLVLTLVQFDSQDPFEIIENATPIGEVKPLSREVFVPRGATPLLDSEGKTIALAKERAASLSKKDREAIVFVSYTDGMENASMEYTRDQIAKMKEELGKDGHAKSGPWNFVYLGANQDAYKGAAAVGNMQVRNVQTYQATSKGVSDSFDGLSAASVRYRGDRAGGQTIASNAFLNTDDTDSTTE